MFRPERPPGGGHGGTGQDFPHPRPLCAPSVAPGSPCAVPDDAQQVEEATGQARATRGRRSVLRRRHGSARRARLHGERVFNAEVARLTGGVLGEWVGGWVGTGVSGGVSGDANYSKILEPLVRGFCVLCGEDDKKHSAAFAAQFCKKRAHAGKTRYPIGWMIYGSLSPSVPDPFPPRLLLH